MIKTIDGIRYLMRDTSRSVKELREAYRQFCLKYGNTTSFHEWLNRGKIYLRLPPKEPKR